MNQKSSGQRLYTVLADLDLDQSTAWDLGPSYIQYIYKMNPEPNNTKPSVNAIMMTVYMCSVYRLIQPSNISNGVSTKQTKWKIE